MFEVNGVNTGDEDQTRYLSPLGAWALAFGCAVGWGAFVMPGTTFLPLAGPLGTIIGMSAGAVMMLVIAYNYHFLMNRYGGDGGAFTYAKAAFGYDHGFLCAWLLVLTYVAILWANATALVLIARNLAGGFLQFGFLYRLAGYDVYIGEVLVSIGAILLFGFLCIRSKGFAGTLQTLLAVLLFLGVLLCLGIVFQSEAHEAALKPWFVPGKARYIQIFQVTALVPWAFVGFESISNSTGEFCFSPRKSFAIMTVAVITGGIAYTVLSWLAASVHPEGCKTWLEHIELLGRLDGLEGLPVFFALNAKMGRAGLSVLAIMLLSAVSTGILGNYIAASRLIHSLAGEGLFPKPFHSLNGRRIPERAISLIMALSVFIPFFGRTAIGWIVDVTSVGATVVYGYVSAAAFRTARAEGRRGAEITGALGVAISAGFFSLALMPNLWSVVTLSAESYLIMSLWGTLGLTYFRFVIQRDQENRFGKSVVVWIVILFLRFFISSIWVRQSIHAAVAPLIDSGFVLEVLHSSLVRHGLIQMALCLLSIAIIFNVFEIQKKRNRVLEGAKFLAEKNHASKSDFLAGMSHKIRTPIHDVLGMNEMIIRESHEKNVVAHARTVESAGKNLLGIMNDILDFSRIEASHVEVDTGRKFRSPLNEMKLMIALRAKEKLGRYTRRIRRVGARRGALMAQATELETFYASVPELNYGDAVRFCESEDILKKTLENFYHDIKPNANATDGFLMEKDYKNYTIRVHALKSSARLIGANALSEEALYLENLGNSLTDENILRIEEMTPRLLEDYRHFLDILSPLYAEKVKARESAPEITFDELNEAYNAIRQFIRGFEIATIEGFIAEVRKYRLSEAEEDRLNLIEGCVINMDWGALAQMLC